MPSKRTGGLADQIVEVKGQERLVEVIDVALEQTDQVVHRAGREVSDQPDHTPVTTDQAPAAS